MKKIRYITDAAMITAVMAVFLLLSNLTGGLLVSSLTFLLPIPITIYGLKYDWKKSFIPAFSTSIVCALINWLIGLTYVLPACLAAVLYSFILKKKKLSMSLKILVMVTGSLVVNLLTTVIFSKALFGYTIIEDTIALTNSTIEMLEKIMTIPEWFSNSLRAIMVSIIPAVLVVNSLIEAILGYLIISLVAEKLLKIQLGSFILSFNIAVPRILTFIGIPLSLVSLFFIDKIINYEYFGIVQVLVCIGLNILVIFLLAYVVEALVFLSLLFAKLNKRYLLFVPILLLIFMPLSLIILGFLDSVFKFRYKLINN